MRAAVFLDRDGVINRSMVRDGRPYAPTTLEDFEILPGVAEALRKLREYGFLNIVVTNQPDLATGKQSRTLLDLMHARLTDTLDLDAIYICAHVDADGCDCRKPQPGLLLRAAKEWDVDLRTSWMVGDRWRDIAAGQKAGCRCCFVDFKYQEQRPEHPFYSATSLPDAANFIVAQASIH